MEGIDCVKEKSRSSCKKWSDVVWKLYRFESCGGIRGWSVCPNDLCGLGRRRPWCRCRDGGDAMLSRAEWLLDGWCL